MQFCEILFVQNVEELTERYDNIIGDVLLSAAVVAYLGPFILDFRQVNCSSSVFGILTPHHPTHPTGGGAAFH